MGYGIRYFTPYARWYEWHLQDPDQKKLYREIDEATWKLGCAYQFFINYEVASKLFNILRSDDDPTDAFDWIWTWRGKYKEIETWDELKPIWREILAEDIQQNEDADYEKELMFVLEHIFKMRDNFEIEMFRYH